MYNKDQIPVKDGYIKRTFKVLFSDLIEHPVRSTLISAIGGLILYGVMDPYLTKWFTPETTKNGLESRVVEKLEKPIDGLE